MAAASYVWAALNARWEPVDTVPKDGRSVLVCVTHNVDDKNWITEHWVDSFTDAYPWPVYASRIDLPFPPSHWMPLPDGP